jgi:hypothetical protein
MYMNSINIPPIMIVNRIYENQNLLSLYLVSFLVGLRTYQQSSDFSVPFCAVSKISDTEFHRNLNQRLRYEQILFMAVQQSGGSVWLEKKVTRQFLVKVSDMKFKISNGSGPFTRAQTYRHSLYIAILFHFVGNEYQYVVEMPTFHVYVTRHSQE